MKENYADLINLIVKNREAMDYYKSLPINVRSQIGKFPERIHSFESLRDAANSLLSGNT